MSDSLGISITSTEDTFGFVLAVQTSLRVSANMSFTDWKV